jgi:hypothetical protein
MIRETLVSSVPFHVSSLVAIALALILSVLSLVLRVRASRRGKQKSPEHLSVKVKDRSIVLENNAEIEETVKNLTRVLISRSKGESVSTLTVR